MKNPVRILSIAGSDSGGGAGIQADIKTVTALGGYAMSAITAVTVQDSTGVHAFHPVPPRIVADQIRAVMADIGADAIKTGMLVSGACVEAVADALKSFSAVPLVVDTVMIAKGGARAARRSGHRCDEAAAVSARRADRTQRAPEMQRGYPASPVEVLPTILRAPE